MIVSGTEEDVLRTVARLGKASKSEISSAVGFTIDYIELICNYLIRKGCLVRFKRYYVLTDKGKETLCPLEGNHFPVDRGSIKNFATQVAEQVTKKVVAEIKAKEIRKEVITKKTRVYPKKEEIYPGKKQEIQIKTDFDLPVEDESLTLESNIEKIGIKAEKEKYNIDKTIGMLKNIQKPEKR